MSEARIAFSDKVDCGAPHDDKPARHHLHGPGNLAEQCPAARAAYTTAMARRSMDQRARQPAGLWLDRLGDRIQHKSATAAEVSLGYAIEGWCDGTLAEALRRYEGRPRRAA